VGFDFRAVFCFDVVRICARQEKREAVVCAGDFWKPKNELHVAFERVQIVVPALFFHIQRLRKEGLQRFVVHVLRELRDGVGAAGDFGQINRAHSVDELLLRMCISDGRDICDEQARDLGWFCQCERHRGLAPHRVADQIDGAAVGFDHFGQVGGHIGIAVAIVPKAGPVIAHIGGDHCAGLRHTFGDHVPIARRSEKTVHDHQGRARRVSAECERIEHSRRNSAELRGAPVRIA
jgi:hypothetical protein